MGEVWPAATLARNTRALIGKMERRGMCEPVWGPGRSCEGELWRLQRRSNRVATRALHCMWTQECQEKHASQSLSAISNGGRLLTQQVFERRAEVGLVVAVFDDDRGIQAEPPLRRTAACDGPRAGDDDRAGGDDQGLRFGI